MSELRLKKSSCFLMVRRPNDGHNDDDNNDQDGGTDDDAHLRKMDKRKVIVWASQRNAPSYLST